MHILTLPTLQHGADVQLRDASGRTALHHAVAPCRLACTILEGYESDLVKLLVSHSADIDARDKFGKTPLHYAAEECNLEAIQALVSFNADVQAVDKQERTPLVKVCCAFNSKYSVDAARILLDAGSDIHHTAILNDDSATTPLNCAIMCENTGMVHLLLARGARACGLVHYFMHDDDHGKIGNLLHCLLDWDKHSAITLPIFDCHMESLQLPLVIAKLEMLAWIFGTLPRRIIATPHMQAPGIMCLPGDIRACWLANIARTRQMAVNLHRKAESWRQMIALPAEHRRSRRAFDEVFFHYPLPRKEYFCPLRFLSNEPLPTERTFE